MMVETVGWRTSKGTLDPDTIEGFNSESQCAYAAGFFDGEGHTNNRRNKAANGKVYIALHVSIGQKTPEVLNWFKQFYGGNIYAYKTKDFLQWSIVGTRARKFLAQIRPYSIVKRDQIDAAVREWENRNAS